MGREDDAVITPAIEACRQAGLRIEGPIPGDTVFLRASRGEFDAVIACYHDQGLIPVKLLSFGRSVNVTLGLPIVRTSVDHGTAFDIAGTGVAREDSLVLAIRRAAELAPGWSEIWKVARTIIAEHPVTGVGLGAYSMEHAVVSQRPQFRPTAHGRRDAHSTYLSVMAETGVPGFLLFVAVVAATVRYAERVRRRLRDAAPGHAQQLLYLQLGLLAFFVAATWGSYANLNMLYLHLVLIWASARALDAEATAAGVAPAPRR